jgi:hypothetical protein
MAKEVKKFPRLLSPEEREAVLSFLEKDLDFLLFYLKSMRC